MGKRRALWLVQAFFCGALLVTEVGVLAQFEGWHRDLGSGRTQAKQRQVPLIILFVHEGCPVCTELESQLATRRARQALAPFAKVVLEFVENRGLAARYGVDATPTILVYCPSGECVFRYEGALSSAGLASLARRALSACNSEIRRSSQATAPQLTDLVSLGPIQPTATRQTTQPVSPTASLQYLRTSLSRLPKRWEAKNDQQSPSVQYQNYRTMGTHVARQGAL